jgi:hypothetical protein
MQLLFFNSLCFFPLPNITNLLFRIYIFRMFLHSVLLLPNSTSIPLKFLANGMTYEKKKKKGQLNRYTHTYPNGWHKIQSSPEQVD